LIELRCFAMMDRPMASQMLKLRRADACVVCSCPLAAGAQAWWDVTARTVTCAGCQWTIDEAASADGTAAEFDRGQAAGSVAREYERRRGNREARVREVHPRIGGLLLAVRRAPQHETAFRRGELGEQTVAAYLERRTARTPAVLLHDRRMPGGHGNIDHLAVAPAAVFVIDAKHYAGKVRVVDQGFRGMRLLVNGRDRTKVIEGLERQVSVVRAALSDSGHPEIPVQGVLCFTIADLPRFGTQAVRGYLLLERKAVAKRLNAEGPLPPATLDAAARALAAALPPA
jgi:hypothetical protein